MELTAALFDLCKSSSRPIIAIDGPAGAGKTTLAEHLSAALSLKYKCAIIHMDDLYNGWSSPFDHHFTDALRVAATSHQNSKKYSLSHFNWSKGEYGAALEYPSDYYRIDHGNSSLKKGKSKNRLRYGVVTMSSPGLTSTDPFESHPSSFEYTMLEDGFFHVLTAGRTVSAACWENW